MADEKTVGDEELVDGSETGLEVLGGGIYLKVVDAEERRIVAACDEEHLGRVYEDEESGRVLDLETNRYFYEGELAEEDVIGRHLATADSINLVGERAVKIGIGAGLVEIGNVVKIAGVPHAQAYKIRL